MRETFYVLEDGSSADPREVTPDDKGFLRHKSGAAVAIGSHGNPRTRGVEVDDKGYEIGKAPKQNEKKPDAKDRQVKAEKEDGADYKTR